MLPWEILKHIPPEISGNMYFDSHFHIFRVFMEGNQVTRKGTLSSSLLKVEGTCPLMTPVLTSVLRTLVLNLSSIEPQLFDVSEYQVFGESVRGTCVKLISY